MLELLLLLLALVALAADCCCCDDVDCDFFIFPLRPNMPPKKPRPPAARSDDLAGGADVPIEGVVVVPVSTPAADAASLLPLRCFPTDRGRRNSARLCNRP